MLLQKYKKAIKLYRSLKCPDNVLNVETELLPYEQLWNMILGLRGTGKTTQLILWGLCLYVTYGIEIQYIRQRETQLAPSRAGSLCDVIINNGYISKLTNGKYNSCFYHWRKWYFCRRSEDGQIEEKADKHFMSCLAIELSEEYKSSYNAPKGDFIIVDEFLSPRGYLEDEFIYLSHLLSTIIRLRDTAHIYLSGNLVDPYSVYFDELQLNDIIPQLKYGDHETLTCGDTKLHIYCQPRPADRKREKVNSLYFGWKNARLTAITGSSGMWAIKNYPRPPKGDYKVISKGYILKNDKLLARELRQTDDMYYVFCYLDQYGYDPEIHILYTVDSDSGYNPKCRYGFGYSETDAAIKKLINAERVYFKDNSAGTFLDAYINAIK